MSNIRWRLLAFCVAGTTLVVCEEHAFGATMRHSLAFQNSALGAGVHGSYEGSALPQDSSPDWVSTTGGSASGSVNAGTLRMDSSINAGDQIHWRSLDASPSNFWNATDAAGFTIEFRAKVISAAAPQVFLVEGRYSSGGNRAGGLVLGDDVVRWDAQGAPTFVMNTDTTDDFHVYRFAKPPLTNNFSLWIDGELVRDNDLPRRNSSSPELIFGDPSDNTTGTIYQGAVDIDYVRWDTTGFYAPTPEPASGFLVALGAWYLSFSTTRQRRKEQTNRFVENIIVVRQCV